MDLIRLLRSLEEFLYELVGWFVFYPRTFWWILRNPADIARYTRIELGKDADDRFLDTISPVLMLILSVVLAHAMELASRYPVPAVPSAIGQVLFGSEQGLLLTRSAVFCIYALGAALGTLRKSRTPITRDSLREPFSIQAFLACPFLVLSSIGTLLARANSPPAHVIGLTLAALSVLWYLLARTFAYRALFGGNWAWTFVSVCAWFFATTFVIVAVLLLAIA